MSSLMQRLAILSGPALKEYKISALTISGEVTPDSDVQCVGQPFTSALTDGYGRVGMFAYNNSNAASGEMFWGPAGVLPTDGFPLPKGALEEIPIQDNMAVSFGCQSGELADLRVLEIS
jgi:hypothetical protein